MKEINDMLFFGGIDPDPALPVIIENVQLFGADRFVYKGFIGVPGFLFTGLFFPRTGPGRLLFGQFF